jgi:hypothetical protein
MPKKKETPTIPSKPVRLEAFDIQGHNGNEPLNYAEFFRMVSAYDPQLRRETVDDRILAIPTFYPVDAGYAFIAYAGTVDSTFLILDLNSDQEQVRQLETGQILATRTVGVIDPTNRKAVIQYVHTGVRSPQIASLLERLARTLSPDFGDVSLEFAPVPRQEFATELASMERITSASIKLTRPNVDWDDFSAAATEFGRASGAHNIDISASAPRNGSLSRSGGIIEGIKDFVSGSSRAILKAAVVSGFKSDQDTLTTLNLNKYIESRKVNVPIGPDGLPAPTAIVTAAVETLTAAVDTLSEVKSDDVRPL